MPQGFAIAIDGPVASGKGTIAQRLSQELQGFYLYSGGMYRAVALACINHGADVTDPEQVIRVLAHIDIRIGIEHQIILNGQDVTERITQADTASGGSIIAVVPYVRKVLVKRQHEIVNEQIAKGNIVIAEGRDTGTIILPDAALKIFLTASPEVRARRRLAQYKESETAFAEMVASIKERDERDINRKIDPLPSDPKAHGYVVIDNSVMTEDETVAAIKEELQKKQLI
jgi:cytidylate kinase